LCVNLHSISTGRFKCIKWSVLINETNLGIRDKLVKYDKFRLKIKHCKIIKYSQSLTIDGVMVDASTMFTLLPRAARVTMAIHCPPIFPILQSTSAYCPVSNSEKRIFIAVIYALLDFDGLIREQHIAIVKVWNDFIFIETPQIVRLEVLHIVAN
jgi:hypothetical protein